AAPTRAQTIQDAGPVQTRTLANGLTVVAIDDDAVAVVETNLWFRFGATDASPGKSGVAHALARMLYAGTTSLSAAGFDDVASRLGARATVTTGNDYTRYALAVPADRLALALRIEADRMEHPSLTTERWTAEKVALLDDVDAAFAQPLAGLYRDVCRAASTTPLCSPAVGERNDIAATNVDDLRAAYRERYVPENATLVIAGDVRAADAFARAQDAFGSIPRGGAAPAALALAAPPQYAHNTRLTSSGNSPYDVIDIAYPAPSRDDPRAGAFAILDSVLRDPESEVSKALLESGYAAGFTTRLDRAANGGLFQVAVTVARNHATETVRAAFVAAIARIRDRGISDDLVVAAKNSLERAAEDAGDSVDGIAESVGYAIGIENEAGPGIDAQRIAQASTDDVAAAARIFLKEPAVTATLPAAPTRDDALPPLPLASVTDDYSRREPTGPVIEARWIRSAITSPVALRSGLPPAAFALPNGVRVLVEPVHASPNVFVSGTVETSPRSEGRGREGTGDLVARLLSAGGAKYDAAARRNVAATLGANFEFGLTFRAHGRARDLRAILDVLADALAAPLFASADVEQARDEARDRNRSPEPEDRVRRAFDNMVLQRADPGRRRATDASLRAVSIEDLHAYVRHFVRPDRTTIAIAGDVDPANVQTDVAATFGDWSAAGRPPDVRLLRFAKARAQRRFVGNQRDRITARFETPVSARASADYYPLAVLREILAARRYPPNAALFDTNRFRGLLDVRVVTTRSQRPRAVTALRAELRRLQRSAVGVSELNRAKSRAVAEPLVDEQDTATIVERLREWESTICRSMWKRNCRGVLPPSGRKTSCEARESIFTQTLSWKSTKDRRHENDRTAPTRHNDHRPSDGARPRDVRGARRRRGRRRLDPRGRSISPVARPFDCGARAVSSTCSRSFARA
ncbi:MAG: insulinase family protein, partial [Candidatus Eremiobacteraeota bacterium]|nr:insulinase family protein [Candidatus Eremiobacteraeota bacterium]